MTFGNEVPQDKQDKPTIRNHEDCQHGGAYCVGRGEEERRIYNRDNPSGEYDVEYVPMEYWECPQCGAGWEYEVD